MGEYARCGIRGCPAKGLTRTAAVMAGIEHVHPMSPAVPDPTVEALEVTVAIKAQNPDLETAWRQIAWWEQTCNYWREQATDARARAAAPDALPADEMPDAMIVRTPPKPETAREQEFYNRGYVKGRQDYRAEAPTAPHALRVRVEALAAELEDPRTQRPGMQRRRIWAQKLRALLEDGAQ